MNEIQVDYKTLVEVMTEECQTLQSQILALKARMKVYDKVLSEALDRASEYEKKLDSQNKSASRKKSVNTDTDTDTY